MLDNSTFMRDFEIQSWINQYSYDIRAPVNSSSVNFYLANLNAYNMSGAQLLIDVERHYSESRNITDSNITISNKTSFL